MTEATTEATTESCNNCGAQLKFEPGTISLKCSHCGAENTIESAVTVLAVEPDYLVPLAMDEKVLRRTAQTLMAQGELTPDDLLDVAQFTKMDLFYVPAYLFSGNYHATWTASFGYDRQEHYTDYENRYDSDLKRSVRVAVAKTKTVTDWRPVNGVDEGTFAVSSYAGTIQPASVSSLINGMAWVDAKPFDRAFLTGFRSEAFEVSPDDVYRAAADQQVNAIIDRGVKSHAQGDRQRDWNWRASINKNASSYLLPIGWVKYEYQGKEYNFWIDGIDPSKYIGDKPPVDTQRRRAFILGYVPAVAGLLTIGFLDKTNATTAIVLTCVAGGWGLLRHWSIRSLSKTRRAATLARKIAEEGGQQELTEEQGKNLNQAYSEMKPNLLANTANDKKLIPGIVAGVLGLSMIQPIWNSDFFSSRQDSSPAPSAEQRTPPKVEPPRAADPEPQQTAAAPAAAAPAAEPPPAAPPAPAPAQASQEQRPVAATVLERSAPERKIILDTVRPMVEKLLNPPVTFEVDTIRLVQDYAYLRMTPIRPTGEAIDTAATNLKNKDAGVLTQIVLKRENGAWKLVDGGIGGRLDWGKKFCVEPYPRELTGLCN